MTLRGIGLENRVGRDWKCLDVPGNLTAMQDSEIQRFCPMEHLKKKKVSAQYLPSVLILGS